MVWLQQGAQLKIPGAKVETQACGFGPRARLLYFRPKHNSIATCLLMDKRQPLNQNSGFELEFKFKLWTIDDCNILRIERQDQGENSGGVFEPVAVIELATNLSSGPWWLAAIVDTVVRGYTSICAGYSLGRKW